MSVWQRFLCLGAHRNVRATPLLDEEHIWTPQFNNVPARDTGEARYTLLECSACSAMKVRDVWDRSESWRIYKSTPDSWDLGIRFTREDAQRRERDAIRARHLT